MNKYVVTLLKALRNPRVLATGVGCLAILFWMMWSRGSLKLGAVDHGHEQGQNGGIIISVGHDHFHIEALFAKGGVFKLFMLGQDQTRVITVPTQQITAYVRSREILEAVPIALQPTPQTGDPTGETSVFEGKLPLELAGSNLIVIVPSIQIGKERYRFSFQGQAGHEPEMPRKVTNAAEELLYLSAGGKYTAADIQANGSVTASQKYKGFRSAHEMHPVAGDLICPVTQTKANPACAWTINGQQYQFCCPPCIDEFVKLAKEHPEQIQDPASYTKK